MSQIDPGERVRLAGLLEEATRNCWATLAADPRAARQPQWTPQAGDRLLAYLDCLLLWRTRTSLVATDAPEEIVVRHIADSLAVAALVPPGARVADIGSGAGLPGLPLAVACPDAQILLVEPRRKRASFLREAVRAAGATNAAVAESRVEKLAPEESAGFAVIVSRAFGPLADYLDAVAPLAARCAPGCRIVAMKGPRGPAEAAALAAQHGTPALVRYDLPGRDERVLLVYDRASEA